MGLLLHRVSVEIDGGSLAPSLRLLVFFTLLRFGLLLGGRLGYGRDWLSMDVCAATLYQTMAWIFALVVYGQLAFLSSRRLATR